jgi:hypothetical protein
MIKTRIQLKYDNYNNWESIKSTFIPKSGEVCIVSIPENIGIVKNEPSIMFKVGNGSDYFIDLPWVSALAADVSEWAKKSENDFIDNILNLKNTEGIAFIDILSHIFTSTDVFNEVIQEIRQEISDLSVSALETRISALEETVPISLTNEEIDIAIANAIGGVL